jgi:hypothetical protein
MTVPFVSQLRTRGEALRLAAPGVPSIVVRVEVPEVWDTVKVVVPANDPVAVLKMAVLDVLYPLGEAPDAFVMKLRGFEVLDESASIASAGAVDGSCFLLTHRHRRPVR